MSDDTQHASYEPGDPSVSDRSLGHAPVPGIMSPYPCSNVALGAPHVQSRELDLLCDDLERFPHLLVECREIVERFKLSAGI
jgi:hypothetical protein